MKNILILLICFISISLSGQDLNTDWNSDNLFFYIGAGASQSNLLSKVSAEGYFVVGLPNGARFSVDVGGFNFPTELVDTPIGNEIRDTVTNVSLSIGKTLFNKKYCMFSAEVGPAFTRFSVANYTNDFIRNQKKIDWVLPEHIVYDEKLTLGLKLKSRLEFKLDKHYGIVLNMASNLNLKRSFYSYGIGIMYGGDFRRKKREQKKQRRSTDI